MRGLMFTEYLDYAASLVSDDVIDAIFNDLGDEVTGAYTAVGNYSFNEFAAIHVKLAEYMGVAPDELARRFGYLLLSRFKEIFPAYFEGVESGLDFLEKVGAHIHGEVRKLYPDSSPPNITLHRIDERSCELVYRSHRPLAAVAQGLTEACFDEFDDPYKIAKILPNGNQTTFILERI
ncbi:heme NO-binding domain-containing protein [Kordiimonas aquimaris]|uniref:heme NO-binding domain-containing protein n=1 Tax=Kordiimonas aquimaris TaxID=707591 RepID=UPI0021CF1F67|nr:heme NO-binding domain-containing protein [Kordiimonas aquimaris]